MKNNPGILILVGKMGAGGKERQIIGLLKGLRQYKRFRTSLAVFNQGGDRESEAIGWADSFLPIRRKWNFDLVTPIFALLKHIRSQDIKLIHTFGSTPWDVTGVLVARILNLPVILGGIRSAPSALKLHHKIRLLSARFADIVVANSSAGLAAYGLTGYPRGRVIHNGIDISRFKGIFAEDKHKSILCMVANFSNNKDHDCVIRAIPIIRKVFPEVSLTLVGRDAGTLKQARFLVKELNISHAVRFITDTNTPEPYIMGSQVCILTTYTEGLSNAILEYMAFSKPVVATEGSGSNELIIPGKTGFLVSISSPDEVAEKVIKLLSSPETAVIMGMAGRQRVIEKFSIESMVSAYEELYESLLIKYQFG
jgi:glycosyltransferase involved in cell wall biosynthesis